MTTDAQTVHQSAPPGSERPPSQTIKRSVHCPGSGLIEFEMRIQPPDGDPGSIVEVIFTVGGIRVTSNEYMTAMLTATAGRIDR